jgi:hypothetical protein
VAKGSEAATQVPPAEPLPLVTPATPCIPLAGGELPELRLVVPSTGYLYPGTVNVLEWNQPGPQPTPPVLPLDEQPIPASGPLGTALPGRIAIRADAVAQLRTTGNPCATAWAITINDGNGEIEIERFASAEGESNARQNWFTLVLAPFRGQEFSLDATLEFPGVTTRTTWPIAVLPFDVPEARLTRGARGVTVEPGCNIQLTLGNGYSERVQECEEDVARLPEPVQMVVPGAPLTFGFPKNWYFQAGSVACGSLEDLRFQPDPGGTCEIGWTEDGISLSFELPSVEGTLTLAFDGCATQLLSDVTNQACGTWYATIEARRSAK